MRVVLIGCGGVGSAFLEVLPLCGLLPQLFASMQKSLVIIEPKAIAHLPVLAPYAYTHVQKAIKSSNLSEVLSDRLLIRGNTLVIDCSVNVDALALMARCRQRDCMYINCSMEDWQTEGAAHLDTRRSALIERSLFSRLKTAKKRYDSGGPTMLVDQGMNPGLISSFALLALEQLARKVKHSGALRAMKNKQYALASKLLGVHTIHIAERDTQVLKQKQGTLYCNTWSMIGMAAEALDPVQMGRGTRLPRPRNGEIDVDNMRVLPKRGIDVWEQSLSPDANGRWHKYKGMLIPHGEANTISAALTTRDRLYRPSVYFVYWPSKMARDSLERMRQNGYEPPEAAQTHVATLPELAGGYDSIGALLLSDRYPPFWSGTVMSVADARAAGLKYSGPTTAQVAIALIAGIRWMLSPRNRRLGLVTPEALPYRTIVRQCTPFLGKVFAI